LQPDWIVDEGSVRFFVVGRCTRGLFAREGNVIFAAGAVAPTFLEGSDDGLVEDFGGAGVGFGGRGVG
jgi:hypothetical protein